MIKEDLIAYYIEENHTRKDTAKHFNISESALRKELKELGIRKDRSLSSKNLNPGSHTKDKVKCINDDGVIRYFYKDKIEDGFFIKYDVSKEDLYNDYVTNNMSRLEVANKYNCSDGTIKKLIKVYGISKPKSLSVKLRNKSVNGKNTLQASFDRVDKDELLAYYINDNHSIKECCDHFDVTVNNLKSILREYNIPHKDRCDVAEVTTKVMLDKYGVLTGFELSDNGHSCDSKPNLNFCKLLDEAHISYNREYVLGRFRYDFKIDDTLVEINPSITHNATFSPYGDCCISNDYHKTKTEFASQNNMRCMHVWDWDNLNAIIELLQKRDLVYARNCKVREVDATIAKEFLNEHHIQGYAKDSIRLGLYYNDELISLMTFGKPRYNKSADYELVRYCSIKDVIGGAEKLFKHFLDDQDVSVVSYCDLSKFDGKVYNKLGFKLKSISKPTVHWYNLKTKQHITDNLLRQRGYDQLFGTDYGKGISNEDLMLANGFVKVYDVGQATFVYNLTKEVS